MNWDRKDLKENSDFVIYSKKIYSKEEVDKLISYDFEKVFDSLHDTFEIIFSNSKVLQNPEAIERGFIKEDLLEYIEEALGFYCYVDIELNINKMKYYLHYSEFRCFLDEFNFFPFIYSENFINWIEQFDFKELEEKVFTVNKQVIFLVNDCNETFYNENVLVAGKNINESIIQRFKEDFNLQKNKEIISWRYEQINWVDGTKWINPDFFYFDFAELDVHELVKNYFLKNTVNLLVPYISNYVIYENKNILSIINGHKKIVIKNKELIHYNQEQVKYLFQAYRWAYAGENSDKLSILRKLVTVTLCEDCGEDYYILLLGKAKDIYYTAIKNFDIYLEENVEQYFEARQKIMDLIEVKSNEISNHITNTIDSMNKTLFAFLGTIFTAIISFVENNNDVLIKFALVSFIVYVVVYSIYYLSYSKLKVIQTRKYYDESIVKINDKLLGIYPDESSDRNYFDPIAKNIEIFNIYWYATIIISIALIFIAYFLLNRIDGIIEVLNKTNV
ncbi:hypothetical protein [Tissierella praeacuta]|uniref:hypothetical protein n=1 Tax=Tissierella praeacuta TaxID=43131 RepID=UPI0028B1B00F|nr:hypothetical protein [Tissierella praeacuta]